jgi:chemotaxis protein CheX
METEYLKPFVEGAQELLSTMLQSPCDVVESADAMSVDVSGLISLDGSSVATLALSFSRDTAVRLVAQLLAVEEAEVDDAILGDGVGELANIVAGAAKSRLSHGNGQVKLSLPEVLFGNEHQLPRSSVHDSTQVRFATNYGDFLLYVWRKASH